jgi:hypothetical protein
MAYVQAWVYVDETDVEGTWFDQDHWTCSDDEIRRVAQTQYADEGRIEIDETAPVAREEAK